MKAANAVSNQPSVEIDEPVASGSGLSLVGRSSQQPVSSVPRRQSVAAGSNENGVMFSDDRVLQTIDRVPEKFGDNEELKRP